MVRSHARDLGVQDQVRFLGFDPAGHLRALYLASAGLVFPTYFEPTNLPPLEAIMLGRTVVCSDLHRETLGDHARYFDPDDPFDLALAMESVIRGQDRISEAGDQALPAPDASGSMSPDDRVEALRNRVELLSRRLGVLAGLAPSESFRRFPAGRPEARHVTGHGTGLGWPLDPIRAPRQKGMLT